MLLRLSGSCARLGSRVKDKERSGEQGLANLNYELSIAVNFMRVGYMTEKVIPLADAWYAVRVPYIPAQQSAGERQLMPAAVRFADQRDRPLQLPLQLLHGEADKRLQNLKRMEPD